jgi:catechol 2,3-dioxygenase-like lactoylglutathione lyase family enzyme
MKRFHVHLRVADINDSVRFYSKLFGSEPSKSEHDYAKWMLDDPRINFAISTGNGHEYGTGIDHIGFQTDDLTELQSMKNEAITANLQIRDEGTTHCCYARSTKHWMTDPQGVSWQHFYTFKEAPTFSALRTSLNFR